MTLSQKKQNFIKVFQYSKVSQLLILLRRSRHLKLKLLLEKRMIVNGQMIKAEKWTYLYEIIIGEFLCLNAFILKESCYKIQ